MGEHPSRAERPHLVTRAWSWFSPHLPELLIFVLVAAPVTFYLDRSIARRQEAQAVALASTAEVQENVRFARELALQAGRAKPMNSIDLHGANLSGLDLGCRPRIEKSEGEHPCAQFDEDDGTPASDTARMVRANLANADLSFADLTGAVLIEADLSNATLVQTELGGAVLAGANLAGANLSAFGDFNSEPLGVSDVGGAVLSKAMLDDADLTSADLRYALLSTASLVRTKLVSADLTDAILSGAYLREADLRGADLRGADLRGADLRGANLTGAKMEHICFDDQTRWPSGFTPPLSDPNSCKR
jgi:uncharacterized protein YjbI with pentapeptide repeats